MPKRIQFEGRTYTFPDDATDIEIAAALETATSKPELSLLDEFRGVPYAGPAIGGVADLVTGVGKGMLSTGVHGGDIIRRALGMERIIDDPEVQALITPEGKMQGIGKFGEQVTEFIGPGGFAKGLTTGLLTKAPTVAARARPVASFALKHPSATRTAKATVQGVGQALTSGIVGVAQEGDLEGGIAPAVGSFVTPIAGRALQTGARQILKGPLASKWAQLQRARFNKDVVVPATGRDMPAGPGQFRDIQNTAVNVAKKYGLTGGRSDIFKVPKGARALQQAANEFYDNPRTRQYLRTQGVTSAQRRLMKQDFPEFLNQISNQLATYKPASAGFSGLFPTLPGVVGYLSGGLGVGLPAAGATYVAKHFPGATARATELVGRKLGWGGVGGAAGGLSGDLSEYILGDDVRTPAPRQPRLRTSPVTPQPQVAAPLPTGDVPALIETLAPQYGIRPELALAVAEQESGFNPEVTSPKGAMGVMQLMPGTAADMGVKNPFDIEQNIRGGLAYLAKMLEMFDGNEVLALAAYNAGPGNVVGGRVPNNPETQKYVPSVLSKVTRYSNPRLRRP